VVTSRAGFMDQNELRGNGLCQTWWKASRWSLKYRPVSSPPCKINTSSRCKSKNKAIPLQPLTGPEGSRSLRLSDFMTIGTWRWQGCQPYAPAALPPGNILGTYFC
jgi:hypothetical protein